MSESISRTTGVHRRGVRRGEAEVGGRPPQGIRAPGPDVGRHRLLTDLQDAIVRSLAEMRLVSIKSAADDLATSLFDGPRRFYDDLKW